MADYKHDHPGQKDPRAHGETHHENRIVDLNTAPEEELADLPMIQPPILPPVQRPRTAATRTRTLHGPP